MPGNSAVRAYSRAAVFRNNRTVYTGMTNALRNLLTAESNNHRRNIKTKYVMSVRRKFPDLLPIDTMKTFDKLKNAYNAAKAWKNPGRTRLVTTSNPNNIRIVNGRTVVINPGNNISYKNNSLKNNIKKYKAGNRSALNKWKLANLASLNWGSFAGEKPYIFVNRVWYRSSNTSRPLTKNMILENLNFISPR
jgi:hypothetical protein